MKHREDLLEQILNIPAENQVIEFKRLDGSKVVRKITETIVGMSNSEGGFIIVGVGDPEKTTLKGHARIFGIEENPELLDEVLRESQRINPPIGNIWPPVKLQSPQSGKTLSILNIPKSLEGLRSIDGKVFIRLEKGNMLLSNPLEIIKLSYAKGFLRADKELVDVPIHLLDTEYFKLWKSQRKLNYISISETLEKTGLARMNSANSLKPTLAAVLLFADYPNDITDSKCTIRILQYSGNTETFGSEPNLVTVPETISGPIIKLISEAHEKILRLLRTGIHVPSGFTNKYIIPERAIKEAITNAVIHRDYHIKKDIIIRIFENRVEVESPGLFPFNITPFNIGYIRADGYRNDLIVKHLREFPNPPNLDQSEGVKSMRAEMNNEQLYPPLFITYPLLQDAVRVILFNEKIASEWEKIAHYFEKNKYIDNKTSREILHSADRARVAYLLKSWVDRGLLIKIIPATRYLKGTKYRLPATQEIDSRDLIKNS